MSLPFRGTAIQPVAPIHSRPIRASARLSIGLAAVLACPMLAPGTALAFDHSFIGQFGMVTGIASTVPSNGDENPYGIVTVPSSIGSLQRGDLLISNFNNSKNLQGTGTTIVQISPGGAVSQFARSTRRSSRANVPAAWGSRPRCRSCRTASSWWGACRPATAPPKPRKRAV